MGDGVAVRDSTPVESTVVATGTPITSSLLGHHVQGGGPSKDEGCVMPS